MKNFFTLEENMILTLDYYISIIETKKDEAEGYREYFKEVDPNIQLLMYTRGKIEAYEEIIKILKERE